MARSSNKVEDLSNTSTYKGKLEFKTVYPFVAGNTKDCHKTILKKLKKRGAKRVNDIKKCKAVIVFCPIVSRFETDINSALGELKDKVKEEVKKPFKVILVAMHHTHNVDYTVPIKREHNYDGQTIPVVHCLFHETKGLLKCPKNKEAVKTIKEELRVRHKCVIL